MKLVVLRNSLLHEYWESTPPFSVNFYQEFVRYKMIEFDCFWQLSPNDRQLHQISVVIVKWVYCQASILSLKRRTTVKTFQ